jgi:outer membrane protein OmpA-like peptidoglycan-associated protein/uncharacterized surface protein with fasciclin (FAS1) repeats
VPDRDADPVAVSFSRQRVLGGGLILAVILALLGLPWYLNQVERDLERRVPEALESEGFSGITASFSGQEGVLRCRSPLGDPDVVIDLATRVRGVQFASLDRSCRVSSAPTVGSAPTEVPSSAPVLEVEVATGAIFDSLADLLSSDPQFSILDALVGEAGLASLLSAEESLTIFAPNDAAFELLSADALAELRQQPELLERLLTHHMVAGVLSSSELAAAVRTGPLQALDGAALFVEASAEATGPAIRAPVLTVQGARLITLDLEAANGVVHVTDRVLIPDGLVLGALQPLPAMELVIEAGTLRLTGSVPEEAQRFAIAQLARELTDPSNVSNELIVDPGSVVTAELVQRVVPMLRAAWDSLAAGSVGVIDGAVLVRGTVIDEAARDVLIGVAGEVGAELELESRVSPTEEQIQELELLLNQIILDEPIDFTPASSEVAPQFGAMLDRLAGQAKRFADVVITVAGFTDSEGLVENNLSLSQARADAVLAELLARAVPVQQLRAEGFGASAPIIVDGVEDRVASRRVEFGVSAAVPFEVNQ